VAVVRVQRRVRLPAAQEAVLERHIVAIRLPPSSFARPSRQQYAGNAQAEQVWRASSVYARARSCSVRSGVSGVLKR